MKKILLLISLFTAFSFTTQKNEKKLKVELTLQEWNNQFNKMNGILEYIDQSNLPHNDVKNITATLRNFLNELNQQLVPQLDTTHKK
jgi:hypothetical protein